jgi:tRNA-specific 2-thiouridylase
MTKILCALSGGVDSSVAAQLLQEQGNEVIGVFMRNGIEEGGASGKKKSCCSASDARDASRVADALGIPFFALDFEEEFSKIIDQFVEEYRQGRTPSPCVHCNQDLKFGHLVNLARKLGAERIATGHYARMREGRMYRPLDLDKDQTYFLFGVAPEVLGMLSFPLGSLTKAEVRALAQSAGLSTAHKPESMEICFVPGGDYRALLEERGGLSPGRFVDQKGKDLGPHLGVEAFTVGQRRGLPALGTAHYVIQIRPETREVVLGPREALQVLRFWVEGLVWHGEFPRRGERLLVQIRARHKAALCQFEGSQSSGWVQLEEAQEAVTPGQAAVFYDTNGMVLGGGWIGFGASLESSP